jgi:hypothetical protein
MPFVTPVAQRYLHLGNTLKLDYSRSDSIVTENPSRFLVHPVNRLGTKRSVMSFMKPASGNLYRERCAAALIGMETIVVTRISRRLEGYGEAEFTGSG